MDETFEICGLSNTEGKLFLPSQMGKYYLVSMQDEMPSDPYAGLVRYLEDKTPEYLVAFSRGLSVVMNMPLRDPLGVHYPVVYLPAHMLKKSNSSWSGRKEYTYVHSDGIEHTLQTSVYLAQMKVRLDNMKLDVCKGNRPLTLITKDMMSYVPIMDTPSPVVIPKKKKVSITTKICDVVEQRNNFALLRSDLARRIQKVLTIILSVPKFRTYDYYVHGDNFYVYRGTLKQMNLSCNYVPRNTTSAHRTTGSRECHIWTESYHATVTPNIYFCSGHKTEINVFETPVVLTSSYHTTYLPMRGVVYSRGLNMLNSTTSFGPRPVKLQQDGWTNNIDVSYVYCVTDQRSYNYVLLQAMWGIHLKVCFQGFKGASANRVKHTFDATYIAVGNRFDLRYARQLDLESGMCFKSSLLFLTSDNTKNNEVQIERGTIVSDTAKLLVSHRKVRYLSDTSWHDGWIFFRSATLRIICATGYRTIHMMIS